MMNRKLNIVVFLFIILFTNLSIAQIPLEIGNRWDFIEHDWDANGYSHYDTLSLKIYADTTIGGKNYFRISDNYWIYDFVRSDSIGVYFYDTLNNKEWLFFKYNLSVGGYIQNGFKLSPSDTNNFIKVYKSIDDSTSYFGQWMRRMRFTIDKGIDNAYSVEINTQLGFIYIDASDIMSNRNIGLMGCKIGDKIYGTLTTVNNIEQIPDEYKLFQNYPNPFNPATIIEYQLSKEETVTLKVYDIIGREIATLLNEATQYSGKHKIIFNGANLSSGIYLYKLTLKGNHSHLINKMILLK